MVSLVRAAKCIGPVQGVILDPYSPWVVLGQLSYIYPGPTDEGERQSVRLADPAPSQTHTERRLHQFMAADRDYEQWYSCGYDSSEDDVAERIEAGCYYSKRVGLLADVTRVFREKELSISRAEIGVQGEQTVVTFYVKYTSGKAVNPETLEILRREIEGTFLVANESSGRPSSQPSTSSNIRPNISSNSSSSMFWSQLEWLSSNF
ncbi:putative protein PHLOEM PROTEIN 2-LIKE A10-like [Capsicum annuum]|nr:putative protein PHLOEM PROTEIN 2-LIKE A10-like [Capsicum annuum]KAF3664529.1 putative protein PHLOEM PROTEIN 2-LIKE A10-like [Capsicum annuum]